MPTVLNQCSIELLEMRIDRLTGEEAVRRVAGSPQGGCVLTPNLQHLREFHRSQSVAGAYRRCELVVPDGMPLVWASRLKGTPLPERVSGSDLIFPLSQAAAESGRALFLLGGAAGTAEEAGEELRRRYPALRVCGTHCPPPGFENSPQELAEIERQVVAAEPDLVYIGLPLEKQLIVMERLRKVVPRAWQVGLGVSFSFVTGDVRRAPRPFQRLGLEWLYRLYQEPRRLANRYLVEGIPFFFLLMTRTAVARLAERRVPGR
jgi:N-acetylglucosaminyldiphosphoundecaprenol N-acetyl-beta-D-mannosaminyltransferase